MPQSRDGKPPRDIRAWVAGIFGLVHGFGFAAVLKEFGLPITALGWSLFSFNFGVEIGQLGIVLVVASLLAAIRRRSEPLSRQLVFAGSVIVILAGGYWFVAAGLSDGRRVMTAWRDSRTAGGGRRRWHGGRGAAGATAAAA